MGTGYLPDPAVDQRSGHDRVRASSGQVATQHDGGPGGAGGGGRGLGAGGGGGGEKKAVGSPPP
ncbi:hypothetical protein Q6A22_19455, partial [Xanthomonas euvesicatoria pv. eucalypti]|nr:hypothetical protein [Xanthomonas euvesicatoria pv. eucalypti]